MPIIVEADCCIAGSDSVPEDMVRELSQIGNELPQDALGKHLIRLMSLHPQLVKFRLEDLTAMDDPTKQLLLSDLYHALGITPPSDGN